MLNGCDLFGGIGGVSSGWLKSGLINPMLTVECNPTFAGLSTAYQHLHKYNFSNGKFLKMSVQKWAELGFPGVQRGEVFISHGSPPCQNYSQATRGIVNRPVETKIDHLCANSYAQFLEAINPPYFTLEQVPEYKTSLAFNAFYNKVSDLYDVQVYVINLMYFGIPQDRRRLFVVGNLPGYKKLPLPPMTAHKGWFSTIEGLHLKSTILTPSQQRIAKAKGYKTLLLPRKTKMKYCTFRTKSDPYPTIIRSYFTDGENNNRHEPFSCLVDGFPYALPFRALARGQGFFDDFVFSRLPVVSGSGLGNAFSPKFICDFITHNFGKK